MHVNETARANIKCIAAQAIEERMLYISSLPGRREKIKMEEIVEIVIQTIEQYGGKK